MSKVIKNITELFDSKTREEMKYLINTLPPASLASLIASMPPKQRQVAWSFIDLTLRQQTLQFLSDDLRNNYLEDMDTAEIIAATDTFETDDLADILQQLPDSITNQVLDAMNHHDRTRIEKVLSYSNDSAGGLMNTDTITVQPKHSLGLVLRYLRLHDTIPPATDSLIVVNNNDHFVGLLPINKLLVSDPSLTVREAMITDTLPFDAKTPDTEVAKRFSEEDLISAPVVDSKGKLLGRITVDDVVDVIIEDADESILARAGLDTDEDTFATASKSIPKRTLWLGINLLTAILAASIIHFFEDTLQKVITLAVLMPIIASTGGVAGTQTLTLIIRAISQNRLDASSLGWLLNREIIIAFANGLIWGAFLTVGTFLIFGDTRLSLVIAIATILTLLTAAILGATLPSLLRSINIDPAIAGGVVLTTATDIVSFASLLGFAKWLY